MKTVWKWVLGIVIALVVIGLIVGVVFAVQNRLTFAAGRGPFAYRQSQPAAPAAPGNPNPQNNQNQPAAPTNPNNPNRNLPGRGYGWGYGPMMGRGFGYGPMMGRGPMMMSRGFGRHGAPGLGFMFMGFGMVLLLAVIAGVAFVFYSLGRSAGIAAALLAQQAANGAEASDKEPPARTNRAKK